MGTVQSSVCLAENCFITHVQHSVLETQSHAPGPSRPLANLPCSSQCGLPETMHLSVRRAETKLWMGSAGRQHDCASHSIYYRVFRIVLAVHRLITRLLQESTMLLEHATRVCPARVLLASSADWQSCASNFSKSCYVRIYLQSAHARVNEPGRG